MSMPRPSFLIQFPRAARTALSSRSGQRHGSSSRRRIVLDVTPLEGRCMLTATPTVIGLAFSAPVSTYGQSETITATVSTAGGSGAQPDGGTVFFNFGSITLGSAPLVKGTATFTTTLLPAGVHEITADFTGAGEFASSNTTSSPAYQINSAASHLNPLFIIDALAVDPAGNVFFALDDVVSELDTTGKITRVAGGGNNAATDYTGPAFGAQITANGLAVYNQSLYIAGGNTVRVVNLVTDQMSTYAGGGPNTAPNNLPTYSGLATSAYVQFASDIAVDSIGNVFFVDGAANVVREVKGGMISTVAGNGKNNYVPDGKPSVGDGGPATAAELYGPGRIAVDNAGDLFIGDDDSTRVREVSAASGEITTIAGGGTDASPTYTGPPTGARINANGIGVTPDGAVVFLADYSANVVRSVALHFGGMSTFVGTGTRGYSGDGGPARLAQLKSPKALAVGPNSDIFIGDSDNSAIRKVSASFQVQIAPAPLTITADDQTFNPGGTFPTLTASYHGFVNHDTPAVLIAPPQLTTTATASSPPGKYAITVGGTTAPNYTIAFVNGTLAVTSSVTPPLGAPVVSFAVAGETVSYHERRGKQHVTITIDVVIQHVVQAIGDAILTPTLVSFALKQGLTTAKIGKDFVGLAAGTLEFLSTKGERKQIVIDFILDKVNKASDAIKQVAYEIINVTNGTLGPISSNVATIVDTSYGYKLLKNIQKAQLAFATATLQAFSRRSSYTQEEYFQLLANHSTIEKGLATAATVLASEYAKFGAGDIRFEAAYLVVLDNFKKIDGTFIPRFVALGMAHPNDFATPAKHQTPFKALASSGLHPTHGVPAPRHGTPGRPAGGVTPGSAIH